jgi:hypothetical protein
MRGQLRRDQRTVRELADSNDGVQSLGHWIGDAFRQIEFRVQLRMFRHQGLKSGHHIALAEGRKTGNPKHPAYSAGERKNLAPQIDKVVKHRLRPLQYQLTSTGWYQRAGRTGQ